MRVTHSVLWLFIAVRKQYVCLLLYMLEFFLFCSVSTISKLSSHNTDNSCFVLLSYLLLTMTVHSKLAKKERYVHVVLICFLLLYCY